MFQENPIKIKDFPIKTYVDKKIIKMQYQQSMGYNRVHACWSEHSDLSFVYGFMRLIYGLCTMTTNSYDRYAQLASF